jgi:Fe-S-cluster containining protein
LPVIPLTNRVRFWYALGQDNPVTAAETQALEGFYNDLDDSVGRFQKTTGAACPEGCGICCTRFTPEILPVEAEYLAFWLLDHDPEKLILLARVPETHRPDDTCPLYRPDTPWHCTVYRPRPLICRLFGFSGYLTKNGDWEFSDCRHMPMPEGLTRGKRGSLTDPVSPPLAGIRGMALLAVRPDAGGRELLPVAVTRAAAGIGLRLRYEKQSLN